MHRYPCRHSNLYIHRRDLLSLVLVLWLLGDVLILSAERHWQIPKCTFFQWSCTKCLLWGLGTVKLQVPVPFSLSATCPIIRCHTWLPNSCWAEFSPVHIGLYPPSENLGLAISQGNTEFTQRVRKKETLPGLESWQQAGKHNQCGRNF